MKFLAMICAPLFMIACSNESTNPIASPQNPVATQKDSKGNARLNSKQASRSADGTAAQPDDLADASIDESPEDGDGSAPGVGHVPDEDTIEQLITKDSALNSSPNVVYARLDHLAKKGVNSADLEVVRFGMTKVLNSISMAPSIVALKALDTEKTVFRINFADLKQNRAVNLLRSAELAESNVSQVGTATVVKGDWLVFALSRPETYDKILGLPPLVSFLESQLKVDTTKAVQVNTGKSEVVFKGRVLERIPIELGGKPGGYYWRSYDFVRDDIMQNSFKDPSKLRSMEIPDLVAGEIFYSLPNGLQAYYLIGFGNQHRYDVPAPGKSIDPGVATDFRRPQDGITHCVGGKSKCGIVINGESCMTCHYDGIRLPTDPVGTNGTTMDQMMNLIKQDRARFAQAISEMNFTQITVEPIYATLLIFKQDRGFADVREQAGETEAIFGP